MSEDTFRKQYLHSQPVRQMCAAAAHLVGYTFTQGGTYNSLDVQLLYVFKNSVHVGERDKFDVEVAYSFF